MTDVRLPNLDLPGVSILASVWHARAGQRIVEGDRLLEVTASDVAVDLTAPVSGVLVEQCVKTEDRLEVGQLLARIRPE